ncbi:MAG: GreA/GreB family elongation factor [Thermocrispum sp.]
MAGHAYPASADDGIAEPGMVLTVRYGDERDTETFVIASQEAEISAPVEICSPDSPLGRAVLGTSRNDTRHFVLPSGVAVSVTLIEARPFVE